MKRVKKAFWVLLFGLIFLSGLVSAAVTGISFSTEPQTLAVGAISEKLTVSSGEVLGKTGDLALTSSSATGEFSSSNTNWQAVTKLTWNSTWANRSFYYRDSVAGTPTITATLTIRDGGQSWTTSQNIVIGGNQDLGGSSNNASNSSSDPGDEDEGGDSSNLSAHEAIATANSAGIGARKVSVSAGRKRLVSVGAPVEFRAVVTGFRENEGSLELLWSFGDGARAYGKVVRHIYALPGTYQVVLNANQADVNQAVSRTSVTAIEPEIRISQATPEFIELQNNGKQEVNLSFWRLRHHDQEFIFPTDTIIAANSAIKLPAAISYLRPDSPAALALVYPNGRFALKPALIAAAVPDQPAETAEKNNPELARVLEQVRVTLRQKSDNQRPILAAPPPKPSAAAGNLAAAALTAKAPDSADRQTVRLNGADEKEKKSWWRRLLSW